MLAQKKIIPSNSSYLVEKNVKMINGYTVRHKKRINKSEKMSLVFKRKDDVYTHGAHQDDRLIIYTRIIIIYYNSPSINESNSVIYFFPINTEFLKSALQNTMLVSKMLLKIITETFNINSFLANDVFTAPRNMFVRSFVKSKQVSPKLPRGTILPTNNKGH